MKWERTRCFAFEWGYFAEEIGGNRNAARIHFKDDNVVVSRKFIVEDVPG